MNPAFETVFSADHAPILMGGAFLMGPVAAFLFWLVRRRLVGRLRAIATIGVGLIAVSFALIAYAQWQSDARLVRAAKDRRCDMYQGRVVVLEREPRDGHGRHERVQIASGIFDFSYFSVGAHYHNTLAHEGVLADGVFARVCAVHGQLVRVEIEKGSR